MPAQPDIHAGHRQVTGLVVPVTVAAVTLMLVGVGWMLGSSVGVAAGLHWLLVMFLLRGARLSLPSPAGQGDAAQPDGDDEKPKSAWLLGLRRLEPSPVAARRLWIAIVVLLAAVAVYLFPTPEPANNVSGSLGLAGLLVAIAFGGSVLARYYDATPTTELTDADGLANAARIGTVLALIATASTVLCAAGQPVWERETALVIAAVPAILAAELLVVGLISLVWRPGVEAAFGADLLTSRFVGSSFNPLQSIFIAVERTFGVDVRSSWALTFLRRATAPVLLGIAVTAWLLSTTVIVDASQQAVRERFGRVDAGQVLEPGLHVGLPWPFDRVQLVDVLRVREMPIGYVEAKAGAAALWTKFHAAEEFNLLLGDGRDLVTVNAELQYRVGDIHAWLYGTQNPDVALETLAYQVLMRATVDQTLAQVLSTDIGDFSARMASSIQALADENQLGVEVVSFDLRGLHPPVAVASDYQAVVAAQIQRGTYKMRAQAYRYGALPKAEAEAALAVRGADADRAERLSKARGEATAFKTLEAQYSANPELYRFRRHLETLEEVLAENPHYVIDARIERDGGALWFLD
ncbi:MAG: protease modulator HflK [Myxococcota bacterium]